MTKLELAICEAENNGEIDLDTRDIMLNVLNDSTGQQRQVEKLHSEIKRKEALISKLNDIKKRSRKEDCGASAIRERRRVDEKTKQLQNEIDNLYKKIQKIDPHNSYMSKLLGNRAANELSNPLYGSDPEMREYFASPDIRKGKKYKQEYQKESKLGRNKGVDAKTPGRYKTTNGLKESVLEEIYEAELCGDITPEERMALIDYMDM